MPERHWAWEVSQEVVQRSPICSCGGGHIDTCTIVVSHLKGTAIVYKPHVLRRCLSSQGTSMYPRVHEGCWATVASSQNCETISGYYKSYYGTGHLYHGFLRCMGFVPSYNCPQVQIPYTLKPMVQI